MKAGEKFSQNGVELVVLGTKADIKTKEITSCLWLSIVYTIVFGFTPALSNENAYGFLFALGILSIGLGLESLQKEIVT